MTAFCLFEKCFALRDSQGTAMTGLKFGELFSYGEQTYEIFSSSISSKLWSIIKTMCNWASNFSPGNFIILVH